MARRVSPFLRLLRLAEVAPIWLALGLLKLLPAAAAAGFMAALARTVGPLLPVAKVARRNLERCFPAMEEARRDRILGAMWDNLGRVAGEFMHKSALFDRSILAEAERIGLPALLAAAERGETVTLKGARFEVVGAEQFVRLREGGGPAIVFTAHMGNWEVLPWTAARLGLKLGVIYRRPNNPFIARLVEGRRGGLVEFLPKGLQGAFGAARVMESGGCLGMLIDVKENRGIAVPFFGRPVMTGTTLARFALRYGAAVHGARIERTAPRRFRIVIEPALAIRRSGDEAADIAAIMVDVNARVEAWIRAAPEQWLWLHRRWPKDD
jgi:KDO2-lipid IV(A) lauroyltransferase